jgi:hypothetical protein
MAKQDEKRKQAQEPEVEKQVDRSPRFVADDDDIEITPVEKPAGEAGKKGQPDRG